MHRILSVLFCVRALGEKGTRGRAEQRATEFVPVAWVCGSMVDLVTMVGRSTRWKRFFSLRRHSPGNGHMADGGWHGRSRHDGRSVCSLGSGCFLFLFFILYVEGVWLMTALKGAGQDTASSFVLR